VGERNNGMECLGLSLKHMCLHHGCGQCEAGVHKVNACVVCNDSLPILSCITFQVSDPHVYLSVAIFIHLSCQMVPCVP
jgi:hypothetical protein